jgi:general secretion pathway protein K
MTGIRNPQSGRQGFVLIAVLTVLALLSGMVVVMLGLSRGSVDAAVLARADLERDAMAQSAASLAAYQLFLLGMPADRVSGQQIRLDQGVVTLTVSSDAGKVDINTAGRDLLAAAYVASRLTSLTPQSFAARVMDWRDQDDAVTTDGAEAADYTAAKLDHAPRNRGFRTVDDLRWVFGVSAADVTALRNFVTIYNPRGRLDVFSAPAALISALPRMAPETVDEVLKIRATRSAEAIARLDDLLLVQSALIDAAPPVTYRIRIELRPKLGGPRHADVVIAAGVMPDIPFHILHWSEGT